MKTVLAVIGAITLLLVLGLFAVCNDDEDDADSFGPIVLVSHEYDDGSYNGDQEYDQNYGSRDDRNRNRDRNRGAFSPGPFDRSPVDAFNRVCMPGATCNYYGDDRRPEEDQQP